MARRKQQDKARAADPARAAPPPPPPAAEPTRRDLRPIVYASLDQVFALAYAYVLAAVIPNRLLSAQIHLWALPVLMQVLALATATAVVGRTEVRRIGRKVAIVAGSGLLAVTVLLVIRVLISAAFLAGVYGAFGKAAAMSAVIGVLLIVELVALVPVFQIKYLMSRAGRRAYT